MRGVTLRSDFDSAKLRAAARASKNGAQTRRLLSLSVIYDGAARSEAAKLAGVTLQIVRDWVIRFNAEGPDGLIDRTSPGRTPILNDAQRAALAAAVERLYFPPFIASCAGGLSISANGRTWNSGSRFPRTR